MVLKGVNRGHNDKFRSNGLSRPFDPVLSLCTQLTPFKTIWLNLIIVYPNDSFQDHLI